MRNKFTLFFCIILFSLFSLLAPLMALAEGDDIYVDEKGVTKTEEEQMVAPATEAGSTLSSLMPMAPLAVGEIEYIDENGNTKTTGALTVTPITAATSTLTGGWYVVDSNVDRTLPITVTGDAHLILMDGFALSVVGRSTDTDGTAGMIVPSGKSLTIYGQSEGTGELRATGGMDSAGIGAGQSGACGTVTINSGTIIAQGGEYGAGIGNGFEGVGCNITINGGTINATGGNRGAGIGSGHRAISGSITINGGTINATGGDYGAGIGGGGYSSGGHITIRGGMVTATGGYMGAGIGSGNQSDYYHGEGSNGDITISGGTIAATGGFSAAGIGGGRLCSGGKIAISGGTVTAKSDAEVWSGAGIGGGWDGNGGDITISGGTVIATGYTCGPGIGGSGSGSAGTIKISGGTVMATGGSYDSLRQSPGIGCGAYGSGGNVVFTGGVVFAQAGETGAHDVGVGKRPESSLPFSLEISDTAALFLKNNRTYAITTTTHANQTFTGHTANAPVYGVPVHWSGSFGAYLRPYTLSYQSNGGNGTAPAQVTQHIGTKVSVAGGGALSRTGYTLSSWNTAADSSGTNFAAGSTFTFNDNATLYAVWTPRTYTVNYNANGGTGTTASSSHTYDADKALTANGFTRTGYTFEGWAISPGGPVAYTDGQTVSNLTAEDGGTVTLYANWTPHTYTVNYDANGGLGRTASSDHTYDVATALTDNGFAKTGYTFGGWATSAGGAAVYSNGQSVSRLTAEDGATVTLYAKWMPNTYTVSYHANGGSGSTDPSSHTYDAAKALTVNRFMRTGYTFAGWATSADGAIVYSDKQSVSNLTAEADGTVTLYAVWTVNTYTVEYNANGGSGSTETSSHTYDAAKALTANGFTRTGYTFAGWSTSAGGTVIYSDGESVANLTAEVGGTVTLYAVWAANPYTVSYDANGGSGSTASSSHTYDEAKALTANGFTRTGYTFAGWATSVGGAAAYTNGQSVSNLTAEDGGMVTLYAKWTPHTYTVNYDANGGAGSTEPSSHTYDVSKTLTANGFTRTGYIFAGWATSADGAWVYKDMHSVSNLASEDGATVTLFAVWKTPPETTPTPRGTIVNCTSGVNVRSGPGTNYPLVGFAPRGTTYLLTGQSGAWYRISFDGKVGYISAAYFSIPPMVQVPQPAAPTPESGQGTIVNCNNSVNVRSGPGTNHSVIGSASKGATYTITGQSGSWYIIAFSGKTGYISADYFSASSMPAPQPAGPALESGQGTIVNCNNSVNVRSGPGTNYSILGSAPKGAAYTITGKSGAWYEVDFNGKTAYISASYFAASNT